MAVVKSNAYGHGLIETSKIADKAGVEWFGVDNVDEGLALRKNGIIKPILILGYTLNSRLRDCIDAGLSFVIYNTETVRALQLLKVRPIGRHPSKNIRAAFVHLKIETGTTRQGIAGAELRSLVRALKRTPGVVIEGVMTHYANIEDTTDSSYAELQLKRYHKAIKLLRDEGIDPPWKHTACSAAAILFPDTRFNLARIGIAMYGLWPSKETQKTAIHQKQKLRLTPALTWKTIIAQIKYVKKGTPVSYGLTYRVQHNAKLAILPIGYWDGYDRRRLSNTAEVLVRGQRCKIVGCICMNMCIIDVTNVRGVRPEDEVVIIGKQKTEEITADDLAAQIGTINYEIVTRINPLIQRIVH